MSPTLLQAVVRVADARTPDADVLARYTRDRDAAAFEELVRRHGPLVWAVCRQLLPHHQDAEDAFQAVFLALVRGAGTIRAGEALAGWLHGVAVRVATQAKRAAARRKQREERAAVPEADRPVPDMAWAALMTAVHEEVRRLPDAERTAFVLCDLEGVRQPDAAARLGWPLGTLSGRLCKARQRLLEFLTRRGIAPSVLAIGGLATSAGTVPAALVNKVTSFPTANATGIPSTVAELARGLAGGVTMRTKLMAAAVVVVGALGLTGGAIVLSQADAQTGAGGSGSAGAPPPLGGGTGGGGGLGAPPPGGSGLPGVGGGAPQPGLGGLPGGGGGPPPGAGGGLPGMMSGGGAMGRGPGHAPWEYKFVAGGFPAKDFIQLFTDMGNDGWEFCGYWEIAANHLQDALKAHPDKLIVRPGSNVTLIFKRQKSAPAGAGLMGGGMSTPGGGGSRGGSGMGMGSGGAGSNVFQVFPLRNATADDVVTALQKAFPTANLRAVAEKTSNSVIIVSVDPSVMKDIAKVIEQLDAKASPKPPMVGSGGAAPKRETVTSVIALRNAEAGELAKVLMQVYPQQSDITADARTNQLIVRADQATTLEIAALIEKLDIEAPKKR